MRSSRGQKKREEFHVHRSTRKNDRLNIVFERMAGRKESVSKSRVCHLQKSYRHHRNLTGLGDGSIRGVHGGKLEVFSVTSETIRVSFSAVSVSNYLVVPQGSFPSARYTTTIMPVSKKRKAEPMLEDDDVMEEEAPKSAAKPEPSPKASSKASGKVAKAAAKAPKPSPKASPKAAGKVLAKKSPVVKEELPAKEPSTKAPAKASAKAKASKVSAKASKPLAKAPKAASSSAVSNNAGGAPASSSSAAGLSIDGLFSDDLDLDDAMAASPKDNDVLVAGSQEPAGAAVSAQQDGKRQKKGRGGRPKKAAKPDDIAAFVDTDFLKGQGRRFESLKGSDTASSVQKILTFSGVWDESGKLRPQGEGLQKELARLRMDLMSLKGGRTDGDIFANKLGPAFAQNCCVLVRSTIRAKDERDLCSVACAGEVHH